jgi:hypothetical protein
MASDQICQRKFFDTAETFFSLITVRRVSHIAEVVAKKIVSLLIDAEFIKGIAGKKVITGIECLQF